MSIPGGYSANSMSPAAQSQQFSMGAVLSAIGDIFKNVSVTTPSGTVAYGDEGFSVNMSVGGNSNVQMNTGQSSGVYAGDGSTSTTGVQEAGISVSLIAVLVIAYLLLK